MDTGPIDAAPIDSGEYNGPTRSNSPEPSRHPEGSFRSASLRAGVDQDVLDSSTSDIFGNAKNAISDFMEGDRARVRSPGPEDDAPLYPRIGATVDELKAEYGIEPHDAHLTARSSSVIAASEVPPPRMHKFILYETNTRYWIIGADILDQQYRMLRIERNSAPEQISLFVDETIYDRDELDHVLSSMDEGNRSTGGLKRKYTFWGLLGFIRFTEAYYMLLITKRQQVAMIGGHYVYQIEATDLVPLTTGTSSRFTRDRNPEETRFLSILSTLDLSKSFYFSYSYDITHCLQTNMIRQRQALADGKQFPTPDFNAMFVWNHHLLLPAIAALRQPFDWCLPIVHGFIDQATLDIFGRSVYITVIGRRSRYFAGARFLKRGVNDLGYVANDVETEQIVAEKLTTSFHAPGPRLYSSPTYTSYLQHRGSIPLYWTQETNNMTPKPDISMSLNDPFFEPAALHFDNLFERYGCPVYVLNLIKARERQPRESKLLPEFENCVNYLNQSLPDGKKIIYRAYDMARAAKGRNSDVMNELEVIAREIVGKTGFFHNGDGDASDSQVQNGIARTNCIDCLDRTNSAQFVIGKHALSLQLKALGIFDKGEVEYDTDAANMFTNMFHDHGDTMAMQYGGSHLVNTVATYRKLNHWQSSSRDALENIKRYYNNSFIDSQRQDAYNLFLGNYVWAQGQPMLWDMTTDYYLHHNDPKDWLDRNRRNYIYWYTPRFLEPRVLPPILPSDHSRANNTIARHDGYWLECYRPTALSSLMKVYAFKLAAESRHLPERPHRDAKSYDLSPFVRRLDPHRHPGESPEKKTQRKGVTIVDPQDSHENANARQPFENHEPRPMTAEELPSILREPTFECEMRLPTLSNPPVVTPANKNQMHLWTLNQFHSQSLNPSVSDAEANEYQRYIEHPLNLPLVTSSDLPSDANMDYLEYVHKGGGGDDLNGIADADSDLWAISEQDLQQFRDFVQDRVDPLTVLEEDTSKKRYKAYRQWLRGKNLFKQSKVDPEYPTAV